jgi:PhnB protein
MAAKPIPDGYTSVTPYLIVKGASRAIEFYNQAFGATELMRFADPGGKVGHAEIKIGNALIMLADEFPERDILGPESRGGTSVSFLLYVEDVDTQFDRTIAAGAKALRPVQDQFYGDRSGMVQDPFGHSWTIATHKEDLSLEELQRRSKLTKSQQGDA